MPASEEAAKARIRALGEELDAHRKRVQAQHPGLSLTAMYNVLEKLRAPLECAGPPALWQERSDGAGRTPDPVPNANPPRLRLPPQSARGLAHSKGLTAGPKTPWPKSLAERVRATELALQSSPAPVTPTDLAKRFQRAKPEDLAEILETLATLGRAHRDGERFSA